MSSAYSRSWILTSSLIFFLLPTKESPPDWRASWHQTQHVETGLQQWWRPKKVEVLRHRLALHQCWCWIPLTPFHKLLLLPWSLVVNKALRMRINLLGTWYPLSSISQRASQLTESCALHRLTKERYSGIQLAFSARVLSVKIWSVSPPPTHTTCTGTDTQSESPLRELQRATMNVAVSPYLGTYQCSVLSTQARIGNS